METIWMLLSTKDVAPPPHLLPCPHLCSKRLRRGQLPPGAWLPRGSDVAMCPGMDYDGSLVPHCAALHGTDSNTSFFHVHEYGERVPHQHPSLQIVASSGSGVPRARASWSALPATLTQRPAQTAAFSSIAG